MTIDMTGAERGRIRVHSRGIGRAAAYALSGFSLYLLIMAIISNSMESYGVSIAMSMLLIVPAMLLADHLIQEVIVDDQGLTRIGLFRRETLLPWDRVEKLQLVRNGAGHRELIVRGKRKKIVLSNMIFLINKANFWEAAFYVLERADEAGWPIKTGWLGRGVWFFHGSTYLPGDKFKDRKATVAGPPSSK